MRLTTTITLLAFLAFLASPSRAQEWTRFRGPNGSGVSRATTVPVQWNKKDLNWTTTLPGSGLSSPVVWGDRIWLTSADITAKTRYLLCISAGDGRILWKRSFAFKKHKKHKNNSFAASTPTCDGKRVYVVWHSPDSSPVVAFDHAGEKIWEYDLGPYRHGQGGASSPILHDGLVVIGNDHGKGSALVAVGGEDGKPRWSIPRLGRRACYTTPCVRRSGGPDAEIVFSHCYEGISAVDPKNGREKWAIRVFGTFPQRALGSPVLAGDLVIGTSGARGGERRVVAVRPRASGAGVAVKEVYRVTRSAPHVPTPLVDDGKMFLWHDLGILSCVDVNTGAEIWKGRARGNFFGSPVLAGGRIYCVEARGDVVVIEAGDEFRLLARNALGERCLSTPAISGGRMYIRTDSRLFSIGGAISR